MSTLRHLRVLLPLLAACAGASPAPAPPAPDPPTPETPNVQPQDAGIIAPAIDGADTLSYRFTDASVPPQYHRSYTITATAGRITRVVDSYGDEIERQEAALAPEQLRSLLEVFSASVEGRRATPLENQGCTGGTGESVAVLRGGEVLFRASVDHCGQQDTGDLVGDAGAVRDALAAHLPPPGEPL